MKKTIILTIACMCLAVGAYAQRGSGRLSLGAGLLYKNGLDVTLAYEHEMNYRHAWEFFANGYLQWAECESCKHVRSEEPHLQLRRGLQTLRHEGTQPLRKPPNRGFGRKRHEEVPCRTAFRLRAQLCVAGGLDAILASQGRRNDKGGRRAAYRGCPRH